MSAELFELTPFGQSIPYGPFTSQTELHNMISARKQAGISLLGEGTYYPGAKIEITSNTVRLVQEDGSSQSFNVRVFPTGKYRIICERDFLGTPPQGWQEVENP